MSDSEQQGDNHWLTRPSTIRILWVVFVLILGATVAAEVPLHRHNYFEFDAVFSFFALYGFIGCVGLVAFSKALGTLLKRPDTYYDEIDD